MRSNLYWKLQTSCLVPSAVFVLSSGLADLLSVSSLTSLNLSECPHISGTEMLKGLKGPRTSRAQLELLNLKSCTYVRVGEHLWFFVCFFFLCRWEVGRITCLLSSLVRIWQFSRWRSSWEILFVSWTWRRASTWPTCRCAPSPRPCRSWWSCGSAGAKKSPTGVCWGWCRKPRVSLTTRRWAEAGSTRGRGLPWNQVHAESEKV